MICGCQLKYRKKELTVNTRGVHDLGLGLEEGAVAEGEDASQEVIDVPQGVEDQQAHD